MPGRCLPQKCYNSSRWHRMKWYCHMFELNINGLYLLRENLREKWINFPFWLKQGPFLFFVSGPCVRLSIENNISERVKFMFREELPSQVFDWWGLLWNFNPFEIDSRQKGLKCWNIIQFMYLSISIVHFISFFLCWNWKFTFRLSIIYFRMYNYIDAVDSVSPFLVYSIFWCY